MALELGLRARLNENRVSGKSMVMMNKLRNLRLYKNIVLGLGIFRKSGLITVKAWGDSFEKDIDFRTHMMAQAAIQIFPRLWAGLIAPLVAVWWLLPWLWKFCNLRRLSALNNCVPDKEIYRGAEIKIWGFNGLGEKDSLLNPQLTLRSTESRNSLTLCTAITQCV